MSLVVIENLLALVAILSFALLIINLYRLIAYYWNSQTTKSWMDRR